MCFYQSFLRWDFCSQNVALASKIRCYSRNNFLNSNGFNCFIHSTENLSIQSFFSFLRGKMCAPKKSSVSQRYGAPEHARVTTGAQFVQGLLMIVLLFCMRWTVQLLKGFTTPPSKRMFSIAGVDKIIRRLTSLESQPLEIKSGLKIWDSTTFVNSYSSLKD